MKQAWREPNQQSFERQSAVIRPFGLQDALLVRNLQRSSAVLAIEQVLTHPRAPLWIALTAPWAGVGVATYILDERDQGATMMGFAQLMRRAARPEADLLHLAPALPAVEVGSTVGESIWRKLLAYFCPAAASHGVQRIFASIPGEGPEAVCLKDAGFSLYTREVIYRLAATPPRAGGSLASGLPAGFRPQLPQDSWALQRLYTQVTPRLVQQAEGAVTGPVGSPPLSWWEPDRWQGIVWEPAGEVRGAVQVHFGGAGHWLRIWGANLLAARELRSLVEQGLRTTALGEHGKALPVYATARDYEIGLSGAFTGFGFSPYLYRARFVKHTVAAVRAPLPAILPGLEARQEMAAHSQMHMH